MRLVAQTGDSDSTVGDLRLLMMNTYNLKIERIGRKTRKNLTLSPDLVGVVDELVGVTHRSAFAEQAMWRLLVEEHGVDVVRETVADVQSDLPDDELLGQAREIEIES